MSVARDIDNIEEVSEAAEIVEENFDEAFRHTVTSNKEREEIEDEESFQPNTSEQKKTCTHDELVEVEDFIINLKWKTWLLFYLLE